MIVEIHWIFLSNLEKNRQKEIRRSWRRNDFRDYSVSQYQVYHSQMNCKSSKCHCVEYKHWPFDLLLHNIKVQNIWAITFGADCFRKIMGPTLCLSDIPIQISISLWCIKISSIAWRLYVYQICEFWVLMEVSLIREETNVQNVHSFTVKPKPFAVPCASSEVARFQFMRRCKFFLGCIDLGSSFFFNDIRVVSFAVGKFS